MQDAELAHEQIFKGRNRAVNRAVRPLFPAAGSQWNKMSLCHQCLQIHKGFSKSCFVVLVGWFLHCTDEELVSSLGNGNPCWCYKQTPAPVFENECSGD